MPSLYPDGTTNPDWASQPRVIVPQREKFPPESPEPQVPIELIEEIVCHRVNAAELEEYLVQWEPIGEGNYRPYSWHGLNQLSQCLALVQEYIERIPKERSQPHLTLPILSAGRKRKSPDSDDLTSSQPTAQRSSPALSISSGTTSGSDQVDAEPNVYNGTLTSSDGEYTMRQPSATMVTAEPLPTPQMQVRAARTSFSQALHRIRREFARKLERSFIGQPEVKLVNKIDGSRPQLSFEFIPKSVLGDGVYAADPETVIGCGHNPITGYHVTRCAPNMGQYIGCEYGRLCECLEYAAVEEARLKEDEKILHAAGETAKLPKRFPYYNPSTPKASCLVPFYLKSRHPIYECNPRCNCGPHCKTRVVQNGRKVPLQIFKTANRGWGLRCTEELQEGQFIDTYRGEIITNKEADLREERAAKGKSSYLYSLDKHAGLDDPGVEACYVVDGELMGGPTRFINHSCEPNCRQYTVSMNKFDNRIYEIAFFACEPIKALTELTFDYLDKDEDESEDELEASSVGKARQALGQDSSSAIMCRCGAAKCRGKLWE